MNLPNQSKPIFRNGITVFASNGIQPSSGIACTICQAGCSALSGIAQTLCMAACNATVC